MDYTTKLPNELIVFIFDFLSFRTLIKCRPVCKRWKTLVDSFKYRGDLAIAPPTVQHWFHTGEPIEANFVHYFLVESLTESVPFNLTRLRRLIIHGLDSNKFEDLSESATNLTHLEIGSTRLSPLPTRLKLAKLEVLLLAFSGQTKGSRLLINCPKLKTFSFNCQLKSIRISNPESLEHFEFYGIGQIDWKVFTKLKTLYFTSAESIGHDILRQLPNLELLVYGRKDRSFLAWAIGDFIDHLVEEKKRLLRSDLRVVFVETPIAQDSQFIDYNFEQLYREFNW